jgi:hypothetical protein
MGCQGRGSISDQLKPIQEEGLHQRIVIGGDSVAGLDRNNSSLQRFAG